MIELAQATQHQQGHGAGKGAFAVAEGQKFGARHGLVETGALGQGRVDQAHGGNAGIHADIAVVVGVYDRFGMLDRGLLGGDLGGHALRRRTLDELALKGGFAGGRSIGGHKGRAF